MDWMKGEGSKEGGEGCDPFISAYTLTSVGADPGFFLGGVHL